MDQRTINNLSLCSGGAGLDLGLELALGSFRTVCWVEWEAFAAEFLASRMEAKCLAPAPIWTDLRTFNGKPWRGVVDSITAGYPCQPFSLAGKRRGQNDPRHLWPHVHRVIGEVEPGIVFLENVPGHLSLGYETVESDLQSLGYTVTPGLFAAREVGASQLRKRLFILAVAGTAGPRLSRRQDTRASRGNEGKDAVRRQELKRDRYLLGGRPPERERERERERESSHPGHKTNGRRSRNTSGLRLNPVFVSWLMGWPIIGHSYSSCSEMGWSRYRQRMRSYLFGRLASQKAV